MFSSLAHHENKGCMGRDRSCSCPFADGARQTGLLPAEAAPEAMAGTKYRKADSPYALHAVLATELYEGKAHGRVWVAAYAAVYNLPTLLKHGGQLLLGSLQAIAYYQSSRQGWQRGGN